MRITLMLEYLKRIGIHSFLFKPNLCKFSKKKLKVNVTYMRPSCVHSSALLTQESKCVYTYV